MPEADFRSLVEWARTRDDRFDAFKQRDCIAAARDFAEEERKRIRAKHDAGESGVKVVRMLSDLGDDLLIGGFTFALASLSKPDKTYKKIALCAHGGYGNGELNPGSDLDVGLVYDKRLDKSVEAISDYLTPYLWDIGYENSFVVRSVKEATALAESDFKVFTSYLSMRFLDGNSDLFGKLKLALKSVRPAAFIKRLLRNADARTGMQVSADRDLFAPQPNIKDGAGGLRDYHAGLWLYQVLVGAENLDELYGNGYISEDARLELAEALDHIWRVRNALHFDAGKREDVLSFEHEADLAVAMGYTDAVTHDTARFMQDYYAAARVLNKFYLEACNFQMKRSTPDTQSSHDPDEIQRFSVVDGEIVGTFVDDHWFEESSARLMAVFHEMVRRSAPLSVQLRDRVQENVDLIGDSFREHPLVRRFFIAVCSRPLEAGRALREMAETGVLERYLPEFRAVKDIVRYEDFHHYPVDEHTLRAVEALAVIPELEGKIGEFLLETLERVQDPHILVLALLCHDLGKVSGEDHSEEGMRIASDIGHRMGLPEEDTERVAFLVRHHLLMTHIALYRDTDDVDIIESFAKTIKSENRLRYLFLLSYADMSAVGPNVWNDWKGSLLLNLYLRAERVLLGHATPSDASVVEHPKTDAIVKELGDEEDSRVKSHLLDLGISYFQAFSVWDIAAHLNCLREARANGFAVASIENEMSAATELVICTQDHPGLFAEIAGCFASELVDVERSMLYTCGDGMALDHFTVVAAQTRGPLSDRQLERIKSVLKQVIVDECSVEDLLEQSRRRIFNVLHPAAPMLTQIELDNDDSQRFTILDVITGDRTGLLYDVARTMRDHHVDVARAHIVTDARRVRDSFYLSYQDHKLDDIHYKELELALRTAIAPDAIATAT